MILIILIYIALCIAVCLFRKIMPFVIAGGFFTGWYMVCYGGKAGTGIIVFVLTCIVTAIYRIANGDTVDSEGRSNRKCREKKAERQQVEKETDVRWVYYLIPIFWPFLIIKALSGAKTRPTDMTPYDYEQHLKCNR